LARELHLVRLRAHGFPREWHAAVGVMVQDPMARNRKIDCQ
jgi:hypothetical protein